jgi:hypothetical protein
MSFGGKWWGLGGKISFGGKKSITAAAFSPATAVSDQARASGE